MRDIVWTGFVSLDGVADSPGSEAEGHRSGGWVMATEFLPEAFALKGEEMADTSALLLGRNSYEIFAPVWRDSEDHAVYRDLPKYVVSTSLEEDDLLDGWGPTAILRTAEEVAALKKEAGGSLYIHGSLELARRLSDANLVDRYHLLMFPVLLGAGRSPFSDTDRDKQQLKLADSETYANGVVKLVYTVG